MLSRPAPNGKFGLATPPIKIKCIGEECPVAEQQGNCFKSEHHLYWPYSLYENHPDERVRSFRKDRHNRVKDMARCRHNSAFYSSWHRMYDGAILPKMDVIEHFMEESGKLEKLDTVISKMSGLALMLEGEVDVHREFDPSKARDDVQDMLELYANGVAEATRFELLRPTQVVADLSKHKQSLNLVFAAGFEPIAA